MTFTSPSEVLSYVSGGLGVTLPSKATLSWEELGQLLVQRITGQTLSVTLPSSPMTGLSAWQRLEKEHVLKSILGEFTVLIDDKEIAVDAACDFPVNAASASKIISLLETVLLELSVLATTSREMSQLISHVVHPIQQLSQVSKIRTIDDLLSGSFVTDRPYPLTRMASKVIEQFNAPVPNPSTILDTLTEAKIDTQTVSLLYLPLRLMVRELLSKCVVTLSSPESHKRLCERYDLLVSPKQQVFNKNALWVKERWLAASFPDSRGQIALQYLESDRATDLPLPPAPVGRSDPDQVRQRALLVNAHKVVARCVGRGALLQANSKQDVSETAPISLSGKFATVGIVSLDTTLFPVEALFWPEFHNGTAGALAETSEISREKILRAKNKMQHILQSKRVFGVPPELVPLVQYRHAGYLFGVGLRRQLSCLRPDDVYRYLKQQNDIVSGAVIVARAISASGSADAETAKLCCIHIPDLLPASSMEIDIHPLVHAAGLCGLGFVFASTGHRTTIETLLRELAQKPSGDKPLGDRECLLTSAGFALGLVALGTGPRCPSDLHLVDRLVSLMDGTGDDSPASPPVAQDNSARVSLLFEAVQVNRAVTLPGACIALALAFMKTGESVVVDRIPIPRTIEDLGKEVRADSLFFKFLTRSLINWSQVDPTISWVEQNLPQYLRDPLAVEHRENRPPGGESASSIDWLAIFQSRMFGVSGMALAIGLKFAGSRNESAKSTLLKILHNFVVSTHWPGVHCAAQAASRPSPSMSIDRNTIETCRCAVLLAVSLVMAGSGDIDCMRYARILREKADESTPYGTNLAVNMALGFLFLGGGRKTFSDSPMATACLLMSTLPRYPASVSDNRSSLQLLRHLYALATEDRLVEAVDLATRQVSAAIPVDLKLKSGEVTRITLPYTLPREADVASATVVSDRYFGVPLGEGQISLQRRSGKQSHARDPSGNLSADSAYISELTDPTGNEIRKLLNLPLSDENNYVSHFWSSPGCVPLWWFNASAEANNGIKPTSRIDWRLSLAELAATSWTPTEPIQRKLEELREFQEAIMEIDRESDQSACLKYAHLLHQFLPKDDPSRFVRLMKNCVKRDRMDAYLDLLEIEQSGCTADSNVRSITCKFV